MTVTSTVSSVSYQGNGATTVWPYAFVIPDTASLEVDLYDSTTGITTVLSSSLYSVTGISVPTGGTITYPLIGSAISTTQNLTIKRVLALTQETALTNQSGFYPDVFEDEFDNIVMQIQQVQTEVDYSLRMPITDVTPPADLPGATLRANKFLGFNASGDPIAVDGTGGGGGGTISAAMQPVCAAATIANAVALMGLTPGTNVQAYTAILQALGGVGAGANMLPYFTGLPVLR